MAPLFHGWPMNYSKKKKKRNLFHHGWSIKKLKRENVLGEASKIRSRIVAMYKGREGREARENVWVYVGTSAFTARTIGMAAAPIDRRVRFGFPAKSTGTDSCVDRFRSARAPKGLYTTCPPFFLLFFLFPHHLRWLLKVIARINRRLISPGQETIADSNTLPFSLMERERGREEEDRVSVYFWESSIFDALWCSIHRDESLNGNWWWNGFQFHYLSLCVCSSKFVRSRYQRRKSLFLAFKCLVDRNICSII